MPLLVSIINILCPFSLASSKQILNISASRLSLIFFSVKLFLPIDALIFPSLSFLISTCPDLESITDFFKSFVTDPSFGKLVGFGLGGILVEVLKDITFRLAPATTDDAQSMLNSIQAAEVLDGVRGSEAINRGALTTIIVKVSELISDFPEIQEIDLNPVLADGKGATAVDSLISVDFSPQKEIYRPSQEEIVSAMQSIMNPR